MNVATDNRWPPVRRVDQWPLALDSLAIVVLTMAGQLRHGYTPFDWPIRTVETIAPFVLGWLVSAALLGLYRNRRRLTLPTHARAVLVCWLAATNVAFLIRGLPVTPGNVPWSFMVVMVGLGAIAILTTRLGYEYVIRTNENRL
ncbi:hypothetical protein C479_00060 [Halovivax asiaticus JCM 14624]|uniref:DUF3054 domain-containing protein n=1 Tax=Halovivax asiaticus JCM 14624 TaxID=1227490 RepID=M0BX51_9EURY|nr:DUF3054 domain-containing protein [Halovivax asiaticus]ELZ14254.1 hypothetical protein C479_00060 [Halovivax asiaticus JCM 14624]